MIDPSQLGLDKYMNPINSAIGSTTPTPDETYVDRMTQGGRSIFLRFGASGTNQGTTMISKQGIISSNVFNNFGTLFSNSAVGTTAVLTGGSINFTTINKNAKFLGIGNFVGYINNLGTDSGHASYVNIVIDGANVGPTGILTGIYDPNASGSVLQQSTCISGIITVANIGTHTAQLKVQPATGGTFNFLLPLELYLIGLGQ